jgi:hypothetical protein
MHLYAQNSFDTSSFAMMVEELLRMFIISIRAVKFMGWTNSYWDSPAISIRKEVSTKIARQCGERRRASA